MKLVGSLTSVIVWCWQQGVNVGVWDFFIVCEYKLYIVPSISATSVFVVTVAT